ncbi:MAG: hypothetical protein ABSF95_23030 [Verrucomicrobiota bacterium]|jgi:hypothetical protein
MNSQLPLYVLTLLCFCLLPNRLQADPLDQWTLRNPFLTGNNLNAIAYGNDQFVGFIRKVCARG